MTNTKRFATAEIKAAGDGKTYEIMLSAPSLDRDGEIVDPFAFAPLPDHMNLDVDHAMTVEKIAGSGVPFYDADGNLFVRDFTFASTPIGVIAKTLVDERHVRSVSVAFMSASVEPDADGVPHIRKGELLNAGIVAIGSNRDAFIRVAKSFAAAADGLAPSPEAVSTHHADVAAAGMAAKEIEETNALLKAAESEGIARQIAFAVAHADVLAADVHVLR
jgi:hypothetical protein